MSAAKLAKELPYLMAAALKDADASSLAQTIYTTTDPLAPFGTREATNPRPRIARDGYRTIPVLTMLPTRYFVGV